MDEDLLVNDDQPITKVVQRSRKGILVAFIGFVVVLVLGAGVVLFLTMYKHSHRSATAVPPEITVSTSQVAFPLYYPEPLPAGWAYVPSSIQSVGGVIMYAVSDGKSGKLVISQQPIPPQTEDVKKDVEFKTDLGDAYISNLNGKTAGFIRADKSLIIISGASDSQSDLLRNVMSNLKQV